MAWCLRHLLVSCQPLLYHSLRRGHGKRIFIPPSLDTANQRRLSINLGGGKCKWTPPEYNVPEELEFHKTIIAGFPSGDKRMIFVQMEALTGLRELRTVYTMNMPLSIVDLTPLFLTGPASTAARRAQRPRTNGISNIWA